MKKKGAVHSPTLATVNMIENFIKENSGEYKRTELWRKLPKKVMYQTFKVVINYLLNLNKIVLTQDGSVVWIYNPKLMKKLNKKSVIDKK